MMVVVQILLQVTAPENSGKFNRYNIGGYFSLDYDVSEDFLIKWYY